MKIKISIIGLIIIQSCLANEIIIQNIVPKASDGSPYSKLNQITPKQYILAKNYFESQNLISMVNQQSPTQNKKDMPEIIRPIKDFQNVQIFSKIYIGSNKQPFWMVFDTGSNWLWVNSRVCENCNDLVPKFDETQTETFSMSDVVLDLHYGSGDVYGYNSYDQVCLTQTKCAQNFSFITTAFQDGLDSLQASGIVGMSPYRISRLGDLFLEKMKKAGVISHSIFSMMIELENDGSKITFGGFDLEQFAYPGESLRYHKISSDQAHWELTLEKMTFINSNDPIQDAKFEFGTNASIIVDSGTSFLLMPKNERDKLVDYLTWEKDFMCFSGGIAVCYCNSDSFLDLIPDLVFHIDGHQYFIPKQSYVKRTGDICQITLMTHPTIGMWILGLNFFENYYTVFDQEQGQVGFAINVNAHPRVVELHNNNIPELLMMQDNPEQNRKLYAFILIVISLVLLIFISAKFKNNQQNDQYTRTAKDNTIMNQQQDSFKKIDCDN